MKSKISISNSECMELVADAAMANPFAADGKLIPLLILDSASDSSLLNLVKMHESSIPGDVESLWALKRFSDKFVYLVLFFQKPLELRIAIKLDTNKNSGLIDGIIQSRAVYIQPGKQGDKLSQNIDAPKILVEIPARTTFGKWDDILLKNVKRKLKNEGVSRRELNKAALEFISTRREIWGRRISR
ncbi:hypothetical protein [Shewanella algae]|uniref:hypothetical protein n=1 Tax=Shewanella algae TaxID=38313 RepID=UPI001AAC7A9B|nr:hypothetical protein [Shewanella algae]MBO2650813.1 hypothetical protein [Shewanella algae]